MQAGDNTLRAMFADNYRYEIPMFQRPYVWGEEREWTPLWTDIAGAANGVVADMAADVWPEEPPRYFLGSIVVTDTPRHPQRLAGRMLVDGQQRLTTLQVLIAAARAVAIQVGANSAAGRFGAWIDNDSDSVHANYPNDRYKLWPLPQDREPYLWAVRPTDDKSPCPDLDHQVAKARIWFENKIRVWAGFGTGASDRLDALHSALQDRMQVALITLEKTDNAQVIFEALNHRGVELSQSDLIKNLLFRMVEDQGQRHEAESLLVNHWLPLDSRKWREDVTTGRITRTLLDVVLTYWLTVEKEDVVSVEHLFDEFKSWMLKGNRNAADVIKSIRRHADLYDDMLQSSDETIAQLVDHVTATKTNTVWPLLLALFADGRGLPPDQLKIATSSINSYLMRRGICALTTKDYNRVFVTVLKAACAADVSEAGVVVARVLGGLSGESRVWPEDVNLVTAMLGSNFYALSKPRLRTFFAGVENFLRDSRADNTLIVRANTSLLNIEHILPQSWQAHWPLPDADSSGKPIERGQALEQREKTVNLVGNLTLTNGKLNAAMQNAAWLTKRPALQRSSTFLITTASILSSPKDEQDTSWPQTWNEAQIERRTMYLIQQALAAWPRPKFELLSGPGLDDDESEDIGEAEDD